MADNRRIFQILERESKTSLGRGTDRGDAGITVLGSVGNEEHLVTNVWILYECEVKLKETMGAAGKSCECDETGEISSFERAEGGNERHEECNNSVAGWGVMNGFGGVHESLEQDGKGEAQQKEIIGETSDWRDCLRERRGHQRCNDTVMAPQDRRGTFIWQPPWWCWKHIWVVYRHPLPSNLINQLTTTDHYYIVWQTYHRHFYHRKNNLHQSFTTVHLRFILGWQPPWIGQQQLEKLWKEEAESGYFIWRPPWSICWSII